ncbi:MAG: ABC transporter substrate-binding protein [Pseudolabrys sp.]|nr:ABC transporter substrate-binding protein [Pseudolabrys sp.]MDP2298565.1 ABC transporter substrate-binding protein [Pseudolabrys sp.]
MTDMQRKISRRELLKNTTAAGLATATAFVPMHPAIAQQAKVKIGLLLPYTGTYAALGHNITDAMKLGLAEAGNRLGGREFELVQLDSEADPAKAAANTNKLIVGAKVDFLSGPVHSGVAMAMAKIAREEGTITIISNAGANAVTREMCGPNIFRTSFSNWQVCFPMGTEMARRGLKRVVSVTWNYAAGKEMIGAFREGFEKGGGAVLKEILVPFPNVEFQANLTEIASLKPDAVFAFFAGAGAVKFVKDYAEAGLKARIPLYGAGFLTDGTLRAQGSAAEGVFTTLHYADGLKAPANTRFREAFKKATGRDADVYAVQGYDTAQLLIGAMAKVKGDSGATKALIGAMEQARFDSPRGQWHFSKSHNPVQDVYLREVRNGDNAVIGVAQKAVSDPGTGCGTA